ncbi:hypothetical protein DIPPA_28837 [Diplonema papillatum]|nr:hypothetical protein DIPPA_14154 [Diplonema papillatum]KAJ9437060.1 hypothetical protein DIPPA_28837 [Diplonema papillatum]
MLGNLGSGARGRVFRCRVRAAAGTPVGRWWVGASVPATGPALIRASRAKGTVSPVVASSRRWLGSGRITVS